MFFYIVFCDTYIHTRKIRLYFKTAILVLLKIYNTYKKW